MTTRITCALSALLLGATIQTASAQSGTLLSGQASLLYQGLSGDTYEGVSGGPGLEAQIRINLNNGRSVGAGLQYSRHGFAAGFGIDEPLVLTGFFVEPRFVLSQSGKAAPYASVRLAMLRQSTSVNNNSVSASGLQINGGGGVLMVLNSRTNLDLGATVGAVRFGEYSTGIDAGSGMNFVLRVGLSFAFGQ